MAYEKINIDDITDINAKVDAGSYEFVLLDATGKMSKGNPPNPMCVAQFEIVGNDKWEGFEISKFYVFNITRWNGRILANGIMDYKATLAAVGQPLGTGHVFDPGNYESYCNQLKRALQGKRLYGEVSYRTSKKDGKTYSDLTIKGVVNSVSADDFDDSDFELVDA